MLSALLPLLALGTSSAPEPLSMQTHAVVIEGRLDNQDSTLNSGEFVDTHTFDVTEAGQVTVQLSGDFDGYLIVQPPNFSDTKEGQLENDDWEGDMTESRVVIPEAQVGTWKAAVTTASKGVGGNYTLTVTLPGEKQSRGRTTRRENGKLNIQDGQLGQGEYFDRYDIPLRAGELLQIRMESNSFDTYLVLANEAGEAVAENDNFEGSLQVSRIEYKSESDETFVLIATSAPPEVTGPYALTIERTPPAGGVREKRYTGTLAKDDGALDSGSYVDILELTGKPGQELTIELNSTEFDTVLFVMGSDSEVIESNDDTADGGTNSLITFRVPADGQYVLGISSVGIVVGDYEIFVKELVAAAAEEYTGILESGDETLDSGEFIDSIEVQVNAGEAVDLHLQSEDFDSFLILFPLDGEPIQVDDTDGDINPHIYHTSVESGTVRVVVTSARPKETGAYRLTVERSGGNEADLFSEFFEGALAAGDSELTNGEYFDVHEVELTAGKIYNCLMMSTEFDCYLGIAAPNGDIIEDNDNGGDNDALIVYEAKESGTFRLTATSALPEEKGTYRVIVMEVDGGNGSPAPSATPGNSTGSNSVPSADPEGTLVIGSAATGSLAAGDETLDNGEFQDTWVFEAKSGQSLFFELTSKDFDTYLVLVDATENILQNDDLEGQGGASGIQWEAPADGRVAVVVTSYRRGESGNYELSVRTGAAPAPAQSLSGRTHGVFVGISDYSGSDMDLPNCDGDAARLKNAMIESTGMREEDASLLINRDARTANVREAILDCSARMQEGDTFVFFYSGHGTRVKRSQLIERDPDGHDALDEALVLHDGLLLDDELNDLMAGFKAGTSLIILDACFSGGFSKDVISQPGRMGLFSSHEDVTSSTAQKFKAGGFLAVFAAEALGSSSEIADENQDGLLSASELSQYIYEGYRDEVVREKSSDYLDVGDNLGYQQLIVDRGGIGVHAPLFRLGVKNR